MTKHFRLLVLAAVFVGLTGCEARKADADDNVAGCFARCLETRIKCFDRADTRLQSSQKACAKGDCPCVLNAAVRYRSDTAECLIASDSCNEACFSK